MNARVRLGMINLDVQGLWNSLRGSKLPEAGAVCRDAESQRILSELSPGSREIVLERMQSLPALANHLGKDFSLKLELAPRGSGSRWDASAQAMRMDPGDLLVDDPDYSRFVFARIGAHRRIDLSAADTDGRAADPAYQHLAACLHEARAVNYMNHAYPYLRSKMAAAYGNGSLFEEMARREAQELVFTPDVAKITETLFKTWLAEEGQRTASNSDHSAPVRDAVQAALAGAQDAWRYYPSKQETDQGGDITQGYASKADQVIRERVWPALQPLLAKDRQKAQIAGLLKGMNGKNSQGKSLSQVVNQKLTQPEKDELKRSCLVSTRREKTSGPSPAHCY